MKLNLRTVDTALWLLRELAKLLLNTKKKPKHEKENHQAEGTAES